MALVGAAPDRVPDLPERRALADHLVASSAARLSDRFSSDSRVRWSALRIDTSSFSLDGGFSMKSDASAFVASTAVLTVPCPEMMTTGRFSFARSRCNASRPSMPGILMSRNTSQIQRLTLGRLAQSPQVRSTPR